jgi:hypothetical protein
MEKQCTSEIHPVFPNGFRIDLKKMLKERVMTRVKAIFGYDE